MKHLRKYDKTLKSRNFGNFDGVTHFFIGYKKKHIFTVGKNKIIPFDLNLNLTKYLTPRHVFRCLRRKCLMQIFDADFLKKNFEFFVKFSLT